MLLEGILDHLEQRLGLLDAIDSPIGVEDLVATVLGVGLGKHIEFDIVGIASQLGKAAHQIIDFVVGQRQTQIDVGTLQRLATATEHIHFGMGSGFMMREERLRLGQFPENHFHHAIMQQGGYLLALLGTQGIGADIVGNPPLQTQNLILVEKLEDGTLRRRSVMPVRVVPLTRGQAEAE